jgi:mannose-6-phosphate isomerase
MTIAVALLTPADDPHSSFVAALAGAGVAATVIPSGAHPAALVEAAAELAVAGADLVHALAGPASLALAPLMSVPFLFTVTEPMDEPLAAALIQSGMIGLVAAEPTLARDGVAWLGTAPADEAHADAYAAFYRSLLDRRPNYRPWGHYENLAEGVDHKLKRITVDPGKRLSYQKHTRRAEHWVVLRGEGVVILDGVAIFLKPGESVDIPQGACHRIENRGIEPLLFAEAQRGDYFGEDDIIRLDDDFGRAP